ncbi:FAD-binding oxidoreductase [Demequina salsinemoris]|uniref:FAD-binding oxidoreductase n=1 Tax=Demequina salsinemoris TaxID=577470 RepID=UPI0007832306|nr:FAD-binding oxidoreductase [Demequina salsinemoris]
MSTSMAHGAGGMVRFDAHQLAALRLRFRGALYAPGDPGYDELRAIENRAIDRHPGLIIRCSGEADVIDGVNLAREHGLLLAVRSGGHSIAGHCTVDGGLVLDLRSMDGVWVNPADRTVHIEGGATWGQVDRETQVFGLAVPGGIVSTTGVGGLTLGGGIGWLHRKWGLACDNLLSATVVLADGRLVTASADEHTDLFWAIRGGGGNFGIVVDFTFRAHPVGPKVALAAVFHPLEAGPDLLREWRDLALASPDEVTTRALYWSMPRGDQLPPPVQGRDVVIIGAMYAGDADDGREAIDRFRSLGEPLFDMSDYIPDFRAFQSGFDSIGEELHRYWRSMYLDDLDDEALDFLHERAMNRPDPYTAVHLSIMGGATSRVPAASTAFGDRSAPFMVSFDAETEDPARYPAIRDWARTTSVDARRLSGARGAYLNFSGDPAAGDDALEQQFGANLARLRATKRAYDPSNLFCVNNNIAPE